MPGGVPPRRPRSEISDYEQQAAQTRDLLGLGRAAPLTAFRELAGLPPRGETQLRQIAAWQAAQARRERRADVPMFRE
jgi:hypothetical protein